MQTRVFRFIDHAHPAAAELFDNTVMRNSPPNHVAKSYVGEPVKSMNTSFLSLLRALQALPTGHPDLLTGEGLQRKKTCS
jgi:hypothetical protein